MRKKNSECKQKQSCREIPNGEFFHNFIWPIKCKISFKIFTFKEYKMSRCANNEKLKHPIPNV